MQGAFVAPEVVYNNERFFVRDHTHDKALPSAKWQQCDEAYSANVYYSHLDRVVHTVTCLHSSVDVPGFDAKT